MKICVIDHFQQFNFQKDNEPNVNNQNNNIPDWLSPLTQQHFLGFQILPIQKEIFYLYARRVLREGNNAPESRPKLW